MRQEIGRVSQSANPPIRLPPSPSSIVSLFLKAQSKEYTRQSQERWILNLLRTQLQRRWEQRALAVKVQQMLNELRGKRTSDRGMLREICSTC